MRKLIKVLAFTLLLVSLCGCSKIFGGNDNKTKEATFIINDTQTKITYTSGKSITFPVAPTVDGATFVGWYVKDSETEVTEATFVNVSYRDSLTIVARYEYINYTITYLNVDDVNGNPLTYTILDEITLNSPIKEDREFKGWMVNGSEDIVSSYKINKGSKGDITLEAVYEKAKFTLEFVNCDGVDPIIVEEGQLAVKPENPTKESSTFIGWYTDATCTVEFDFDNPITKKATIYAKWDTDVFKTLQIKDTYDSITCNYKNNDNILVGTEIKVSVKNDIAGFEFKYLKINDDVIENLNYSFDMPNSNVTVEAIFEVIDCYIYDKASESNLIISELNYGLYDQFGNIVFNLFGNNITYDDYKCNSTNGLIIRRAYLEKLDCGIYSFIFSQQTIIKIYIKQSDYEIRNFRIDYDINYPSATILFDEISSIDYEYSLNSSEYKIVHSGDTFDINKANNNIIEIKNSNKSKSITLEGYKSVDEKYFNNTFTYNGNKYDYYLDSDEDVDVMLRYLVYVLAPVSKEKTSDNTIKCMVDKTIPLYSQMSDAGFIFTRLTKSNSITFRLASQCILNNQYVELYAYYADDLNSVDSNQELTTLSEYSLVKSSRSDDFDDFKINSFTKTQEIRTLYELEDLDYGVKPDIKDTRAKYVYDSAIEVLRTYVDDTMTDYEKLNAIYEWLSINITYDNVTCYNKMGLELSSNYASYTSYGLFKNKTAVCDGFASALKIMCLIEGIDAYEVIGTGNGGGHAWNKVIIDDVVYGVDVTWSRVKDASTSKDRYISHDYIFMSEVDLMDTYHLEEYSNGEKNCSVNLTANAEKNYFDLIKANGISLIVTTSTQFRSLVDYYKSINCKIFEIKIGGSNVLKGTDFYYTSNTVGTSSKIILK